MSTNDGPEDPIRLADLVAYAEGRLPPGSALRARVEEHLRRHADDAARVEAYQEQDRLLREVYAGVTRQPLPARLQTDLTAPEHSPRRLALAASLAAGIAIGWLVAQVELAPYATDADDAVAERAASDLTDAATAESRSAVNTSVAAGLPDLSPIGLTPTGELGLEDPAAGLRHYEYVDPAGRVVNLLVTREPMIDAASVYTLQTGENSVAYWRRGDTTFLLSGPVRPERIQEMAHAAMAHLDSAEVRRGSDGESPRDGVVAGSRNAGGADGDAGARAVEDDPANPTPVVDRM